MAHIVFMASDLTSALHGCLRLARLLRRQGHRVTFLSAAVIEAVVTANGAAFQPLPRERELAADPARHRIENAGTVGRLRRRRETVAVRQRLISHWRAGDELADALDALQPDIVLVDYELHPHIVTLATGATPLLLYTVMLNPRRAPHLPPLSSGLRPDQRWFAARRAAAWAGVRLTRAATRLAGRLLLAGTDRVNATRALARHTGFPFRRHVSLGGSMPLAYRKLPTLIFNAAEFDLPHGPLANVRYVGPLIDLDRNQTGIDAAFDPWWRDFLSRRRPDEPLIYATIGTFWAGDPVYLRRLIDAAAERPTWHLVLSIGRSLTPADLAPLPPNVAAFQRVPQLELLRHADACITHGGISTINEAIYFGVPLLVYATHHVDQDGNAARVAYHRLGLRGELRRESPAAVVAKIEALLRWDHAPIEAMRAAYATYGNGADALAAIEARLP